MIAPDLADVLSHHRRPHPRRPARRAAGGLLRQERTRLQPADAAAVPMAPAAREPRRSPRRRCATYLDHALTAIGVKDAAGAPDALHLPRFPQAVHHRRDPARHAATHRPTRRRPPRHQHHHGLQGRLPRGGDQRPPRIHRPPPRHCAPARNTAPPPTRNGPSSSATSNAARSPSATAAAPTTPPASTSLEGPDVLRDDML